MTPKSAVEFVPALGRHVGTIGNRMRAIDKAECAALGHGPKQASRLGLWNSIVCWTAVIDGVPEAMFGLVVSSAIDGRGTPWMLGTEAVYQHGRELLLYGPAFLARMADSTPCMENIVSADNHKAIRLLRGWGFAVDEDLLEIGGVAFRAFRMTAHV